MPIRSIRYEVQFKGKKIADWYVYTQYSEEKPADRMKNLFKKQGYKSRVVEVVESTKILSN